jgi:hypothetical protein
MIAKAITIMIYDWNSACLAMSTGTNGRIICNKPDPGSDRIRWAAGILIIGK